MCERGIGCEDKMAEAAHVEATERRHSRDAPDIQAEDVGPFTHELKTDGAGQVWAGVV